jgi:hypothetical protein
MLVIVLVVTGGAGYLKGQVMTGAVQVIVRLQVVTRGAGDCKGRERKVSFRERKVYFFFSNICTQQSNF